MKLLSEVFVHDDHYPDGPAFCILELTPEYARELLSIMNQLADIKKKHPDVSYLVLNDNRVDYYEYSEFFDELYESIDSSDDFRSIDNKTHVDTDNVFHSIRAAGMQSNLNRTIKQSAIGLENTKANIFEKWVDFEGYIVNTSIVCSTGSISRNILEEIVNT